MGSPMCMESGEWQMPRGPSSRQAQQGLLSWPYVPAPQKNGKAATSLHLSKGRVHRPRKLSLCNTIHTACVAGQVRALSSSPDATQEQVTVRPCPLLLSSHADIPTTVRPILQMKKQVTWPLPKSSWACLSRAGPQESSVRL